MTVHELITELHKIPNQNLPVWTEGGYIHIGELLHIQIGKSEEEKAMSELKPCPFCGGKAECFTVNSASWVYCTDCRCETWVCDTPEEAIAAWNRRAE